MISKDWTPKERLEVIATIAKQLAEHPAVLRDYYLADMQERLLYLATESAQMLESNRKAIIEGHKRGKRP
jgi:hypothetical protein